MSRDNHIEQMAKDMCEYYYEGTCYQDKKPCDCKCDIFTDAQYLYAKGYRKASDLEIEIADLKSIAEQYQKQFEEARTDVAREIFAEIEQELLSAIDNNLQRMAEQEEANEIWRICVAKKNTLCGIYDFIAKLKKKYESEGEK